MSTAELRAWLFEPDPLTFPYEAVVREYRGYGKHFVPSELLTVLTEVRDLLPSMHGPWPQLRILTAFLATALDKHDGVYDYPSYLARSLLELPDVDDPVEQAPFARSRCDRLLVQLVADTLTFEFTAADGRTTFLPKMRPAPDILLKRYKHALRAIRPALTRMSLDARLTADQPEEMARQVGSIVAADMSAAERLTMRLSILPVYTAHDEYLFLRVLQSFETTFSLLAVQLRATVVALDDNDVTRAVFFLNGATTALEDSAPLFSMLATMQVEAFRTFREFTDGASAIQSRSYKAVESLCRTPDESRLGSLAFTSVPEVQARVQAGQRTLQDARRALITRGTTAPQHLRDLEEAATRFAETLVRWRHTHYRVAVRMLGRGTGTGYTEGTPYLDRVRTIPVFDEGDIATSDAATCATGTSDAATSDAGTARPAGTISSTPASGPAKANGPARTNVPAGTIGPARTNGPAGTNGTARTSCP